MGAIVLDGKACGAEVEAEVKAKVSVLNERGITPHLAVVIVGDDPASHVYVGAKERACARVGVNSTRIDLPADSDFSKVVEVVEKLNSDPSVHGILVQSPLPKGMDELAITDMIDPTKDVDGFHPVNLGKLVQGRIDGLVPCTPAGVVRLLEWGGVDISGKSAVVIGRSRIVGAPVSLLLGRKGVDATVTISHSRTPNIAEICRSADIVIAAVGRADMVQADWVKPGAAVVDVGVNRVDDDSREQGYRLAGDVHPDVADVAGYLSPVPGGVGPMTIAMLMSNTVSAATLQL
ncbi:MAG TPA: bifunctional methylenetetrahydrofolate dehydrogenase/methenyltetrahydrofolate cyclohydrolase FolD [Candidatus Poseidoniales archaeon]|nr:MAG: bifunctional methylenetetrahydrofolate dehydrogenase/methenyltetrahydrofolate cyclohydrolase FolD [Euryarchaeota archaeon]HHZ74045.1 bifunctional methylenetetrahydrofolate dehydrogenase/methenyltetrahydrofolate cyclohydrolase FolD [Candidatus Poseidoniales archaeon]PXY75499.1 MAG: bifunctional methylenetetrahydrofolate dehydrogenase/methenyltetrahydrofolate cyclohydrolase FolD [Euryarchaeota archaeon]PXY77087.1 MAG: bifunctional methylenetetrahydrofolate dehydrogenase/methenyltetrahydrof